MTRSRSWIGVLLASGLILTAAGCTGTDFLNTGNATVRVEAVAVGTPIGDFDCLIFELDEMKIRPLDGICDDGSANPDDPCLNNSDCTPGACVGSNAAGVIGNNGIIAVLSADTSQGDLWDGPCAP